MRDGANGVGVEDRQYLELTRECNVCKSRRRGEPIAMALGGSTALPTSLTEMGVLEFGLCSQCTARVVNPLAQTHRAAHVEPQRFCVLD